MVRMVVFVIGANPFACHELEETECNLDFWSLRKKELFVCARAFVCAREACAFGGQSRGCSQMHRIRLITFGILRK